MTKTVRTLTYEGDLLVHDTHDEATMSDGSYSWYFDGNTQGLVIPVISPSSINSPLNLSPSAVDWTIEFWACPTSTDAIERTVYSKRFTSAGFTSVLINLISSSGNPPYWQFYVANAAGTAWTVASTNNVSADILAWQHIALVRDGANIYAYKNGVRTTLSSAMSTAAIYDDGYPAAIAMSAIGPVSGATNYSAYRYRGYLSNFRITKGVALYTTATIDIPKSPLVVQGSVTSLLTCQSSTFKDNSSFGHLVYDINEPTISYRNPFTSEMSLKLTGFSQLQVNTPTVTSLTGTWTIEFWIYNLSFISPYYDPTGIEGVGYVFNGNPGSDANRVQIGATPTGQLYYYHENGVGGTFTVNSGTNLMSLNRWYHIAVVVYGSTLGLYIDGTPVGSGTLTNNPSPGSGFYIGFLRSGGNLQWCQGYMYNFRYLRGASFTTVYPAIPGSSTSFDPPTQPLLGSGAQLFLFSSGATFKDYSPRNTTFFIGGSPEPSYMNPFNTMLMNESSKSITNRYTNSVRFDGANYYLSLLSSQTQLQPGSNSFTIEAWIYPLSTSQGCIAFFGGSATFWGIRLERNSGGGLQVLLTNDAVSWQINYTTGSITNNVWTHVALVKNGTSVLLYINGTQSGVTQTITGSVYTGGTLNQIGTCNSTNYFNGYISNLRFTKGIAVYTGNFTVPTSPLDLLQSAGTNIAAITDPTSVSLLICQEFGNFADRSVYDIPISTLPTTLNTTTLREPIRTSKLNPFNSRTDSDFSNLVDLTNNGFNSALFNGTSQLLATNAPGLTSENFTIECWFYLTSNLTFVSPENIYVGQIFGGGVANSILFYLAGNGVGGGPVPTGIAFDAAGAGATGPSVYATGLTIPIRSWNHVAVSRSGSTWALWLNGVKQTLNAGSTRLGAAFTAGTISIGYNAENASYRYWFPGYISNLRIVRGYAVYDPAGGNISVPTTPLKAINGTYLLTCQSPTIIDNSATPFNFTSVSGTVDRFNPFSRTQNDYSVLFNGSSQYLSIPYNTAFQTSTGSWTIECWVYPTTIGTTNKIIACLGNTTYDFINGTGFQYTLYIGTSGNVAFNSYIGSSSATTVTTSIVLSASNWYHIAVVYSGTTLNIYINGVLAGTNSSLTIASQATLSKLQIGTSAGFTGSPSTEYFPGYISNFRVVKGTALYTTNFTPPTASLTAIANTGLLTCVGSQVLDFSNTRSTISNVGGVSIYSTIYPPFTVTPLNTSTDFPASKLTADGTLMTKSYLDDFTLPGKKYGVQFNGSTQYLTAGAVGNFNLLHNGLTDFTVEAWIYPTSVTTASQSTIISTDTDTASIGAGLCVGLSTNGDLSFYVFRGVSGASLAAKTSTGAIVANMWQHVAVTFVASSKTYKIYVNGIDQSAVTSSTNFTTAQYSASNHTYVAAIGRSQGSTPGGYFPGHISNLRVVNTVVYTANFTPPTQPLDTISGLGYSTSLLACRSPISANIDNSPSSLTLTAFGSPTTSDVQTTFYSGLFGGGTQYLSTPSDAAFTFGTGNFTIEAWVYRTGTNPVNSTFSLSLFDFRTTEPQTAINIGFDGGNAGFANKMYVYVNGAYPAVSTTSIALNTWYHVAFVRSGGTAYLYINGAMEASYSISSNFTTSTCFIGARFAALTGDYRTWQGQISNVRIIKGTAVYPSTGFIPSTNQLKVVSNTSLLALQTETVTKDSSNNNFTITNGGSVTSVAPISWTTIPAQKQYATGVIEIAGQLDDYTKAGAVSAFFNGSQYLSTPSSTAFALGTGDFTVETWIYWTKTVDASWIADFRASGGGANQTKPQLVLWLDNSLKMYVGTSEVITSGASAVSFNTWYHVAMVRSSGVSKLYLNGSQVGSSYTDPNNYGTTAQDMIIGEVGDNRAYAPTFFYGYMSNLRVTKGVAVYTGNFTPSRSPLQITQSASANIAAITSTSSVSLLTCQNNNLSDISTNQFSITNSGGVTTTFKKIPF